MNKCMDGIKKVILFVCLLSVIWIMHGTLLNISGFSLGTSDNTSFTAFLGIFIAAQLILLLIAAFPCIAGAATPINSAGYYKNIKLCGKVKIVDSFPDIKVKVVDSFPDLKVKVVQSFPNNIGEWQFVEYGEDFRVQFVDSFPDIKIKYVSSFPGVAK